MLEGLFGFLFPPVKSLDPRELTDMSSSKSWPFLEATFFLPLSASLSLVLILLETFFALVVEVKDLPEITEASSSPWILKSIER